ncbi:uncharacterized protein KY384_004643 [Bacidia gigantensis]|uniref:uncharacterized protein n=1 Tax=Bacidia gigantensis TaxID=2732470 RepID=UPI001D041B49|nr:uncharacterized protein KY384_004643 [Bacidia gigantensis]KAG8530605.1 hypothetical protein KY384_004643 [Bacidia gigantensis]
MGELQSECLGSRCRPLRRTPQLKTSNPLNVHKTLKNLEQLLTDTRKIKEQYGLDAEITEEEVGDLQTTRSVFGNLFGRKKQRFVNDSAKVHSRRNNAWKKLKWATSDAAKFRLLLQDIHDLNARLQSLLHPADQYANARDLNESMRRVVANSPTKGLLDAMSGPLASVDPAIAASARLRQQGFMLDLIPSVQQEQAKSEDHTRRSIAPASPKPNKSSTFKGGRDLRVPLNGLSKCRGHARPDVFREEAIYKEEKILIEWKDISSALETRLKYRVANVASFLAVMADPSFHSLQCLGYVKGSSVRYGYLFKYPTTKTSTTKPSTLFELLSSTSLKPSLNQRLSVAQALAETTLQLHTAGWLHKSINPENVLVCKEEKDTWDDHRAAWQVYLGGYDFARADNPLEATEDPTSRDFSELYRHPSSLGQERTPYNKEFDLYSVGCLLIELALWDTLPNLLWRRMIDLELIVGQTDAQKATQDPSKLLHQPQVHKKELLLQHREDLLSEGGPSSIHAELEHRLGLTYCKLVEDCLNSADDLSREDECSHNSIETQQQVASVLKSLTDTL